MRRGCCRVVDRTGADSVEAVISEGRSSLEREVVVIRRRTQSYSGGAVPDGQGGRRRRDHRLSIIKNSVKTHVTNIFLKPNFEDRRDAVAEATQKGTLAVLGLGGPPPRVRS